MTEHSITTAKLLALLNVSAGRPRKRRRQDNGQDDDELRKQSPVVKLNRRRSVIVEESMEITMGEETTARNAQEGEQGTLEVDASDLDGETASTPGHFENSSALLSPRALEAIAPPGEHSRIRWKVTQEPKSPGRAIVTSVLEDRDGLVDVPVTLPRDPSSEIQPKFWKGFSTRSEILSDDLRSLQNDILPQLLSYRDVHYTHARNTEASEQSAIRDVVTMHLATHVKKKLEIIARNNARISHAEEAGEPPAPESIQDQGFTRPSTLIIVPFRNTALRWMTSFVEQFSSEKSHTLGWDRMISEFSLPQGTVDKLAEAEDLGIYPVDHVQTFKGNIDDNFRVGCKVLKKSLKLFETFYGSDLIVASPLGLRLAIERDGNADFLSSIEVVVADQVDVMTMQNWTHLQYVLSQMNNLPKEAHETDFSRVKSWFLDGHSRYLRQSVFISSYETPQMRAMFNNELKNVAGKVRFDRRWTGVKIPLGIKQSFVKFDCPTAREEVDKRFDFFTKEFFPILRKSAVLSVNTLIFVPSYFDFIRVRNWMKKDANLSVAFISEESSVSEMDRARQQFDKGKKSFLVITERFHFFRRYRIKGIMNVIFYAPPDHANFYSELLAYPFFKQDVEGSDVTCKVLYSKYDAMALERLVGTRDAASLINSS